MDRDQHVQFQQEESPLPDDEQQSLDVPKKKKGFLSGLLRRASLAGAKRPLLKKVGLRALGEEDE